MLSTEVLHFKRWVAVHLQQDPRSVQTAIAVVEISREVEVYIKNLNTYVCPSSWWSKSIPQYFFWEVMRRSGESNIWKPREKPRLTSSGVTIECCSKECVPLVTVTKVAGLPPFDQNLDAERGSLPAWYNLSLKDLLLLHEKLYKKFLQMVLQYRDDPTSVRRPANTTCSPISPKDPNCTVRQMTKTTRTKCNVKTHKRVRGQHASSASIRRAHQCASQQIEFGEESTPQHRRALNRTRPLFILDSKLSSEQKKSTETVKCLQKLMPPSIKPGRNSTDSLLEFIKAGVELAWAYDTWTADRSQINDTAEKGGSPRKGKHCGSDGSEWLVGRMVERTNGMRLSTAKDVWHHGRWQDCVWKKEAMPLSMVLWSWSVQESTINPINPKKVEARWHELGAKMCFLRSSGYTSSMREDGAGDTVAAAEEEKTVTRSPTSTSKDPSHAEEVVNKGLGLQTFPCNDIPLQQSGNATYLFWSVGVGMCVAASVKVLELAISWSFFWKKKSCSFFFELLNLATDMSEVMMHSGQSCKFPKINVKTKLYIRKTQTFKKYDKLRQASLENTKMMKSVDK